MIAPEAQRTPTSDSLPDGSVPGAWETPPAYTRTYFVDGASPEASDAGSGSADRPFRTIGRAAEVAQAGERVLVAPGIYREAVRPIRGGAGPDAMVTYEAAAPHEVVIRGSCVLPSAWRRAPSGPVVAWTLELPDSEFSAYNPFAHENPDLSDANSYHAVTHAHPSAADSLRRGMLFQDGRRVLQVASRDDLLEREGAFWVAEDGWTVHLRPFGDADPNTVTIEAANRAQLFAPAGPGVSHLRLSGFVFEHVANAFSYPVEAAVSPMGGQSWIIEDNIIRNVNSDAVNIGSHVWVWGGDAQSRAGSDCIVRRNVIADCGVSGIKGLTAASSVIAGNVFVRIGWQDVELGYDNGGLKLLVTRNTAVRRNLFRDFQGAPGVWLDWDTTNCRVTENTMMDIRHTGGAVFIEASDQANWVDHNVIWDIRGNGVFLQDTDAVSVFDNLIGRCTDAGVHGRVCTDRKLRGRTVTCRGNVVRANTLVDNKTQVFFDGPQNHVEGNFTAQSADPAGALGAQAPAPRQG